MHSTIASLLCAVSLSAADPSLPRPIFYLPLDGTTDAAIAGGRAWAGTEVHEETILTLARDARPRSFPGKVGLAWEIGDAPLVYRTAENFRPDEGSCAFWVQPQFCGDDAAIYCAFFGAARWGMLYKYETQTTLTFGTARPDAGDLYYDCGGGEIRAWRPGQWHHVAATWSRREGIRRAYVDGKLKGQGRFPHHEAVADGPLFIGGGCDLFPGKTAHARLDEVAIWDRPLCEEAVARLYAMGMEGKPLWPVPAATASKKGQALCPASLKLPAVPPPGSQKDRPAVRVTSARERVDLKGPWRFLPAERPLSELPHDGWGTAAVPGYWTRGDSLRGPDGRSQRGLWGGTRLADCTVGYYVTSFAALPGWKDKAVLLHIDGVDGLAGFYLNGELLGQLGAWEDQDYDLSDRLRWGEPNTVVIALHSRGTKAVAGIYGKTAIEIGPRSAVRDVVVRPSVEHGRIAFSCGLRHHGPPSDARLEFEVLETSSPTRPAKKFSQAVQLKPDPGEDSASAETQRAECSFEWPDARPWTYDAPVLYDARVRLYVGDRLVDESPSVRFGFREFTMRGSEFLLNGKPTHLRGHQIDLGWGDQMAWVRELKGAGMNAFELSGPIRCEWYGGGPYQHELYEQILDYADRHGLIALPILPDAELLKDSLFDPEVARQYRRRLEKFTRRYGNHPSICMWYMHFNLAGYAWYLAPSKIDGSHKPAGMAFRAKERYAREAQRIAQSVDPRPLYHHACGNFGDIFSMNCYLGPNIPLQEREEWPLRWAEKRPFPLLACEHCLMLVPYWFRPRQFPLSVVYAGEPIFDELAAQYLGRRAYRLITPERFDLYDLGRAPRGSRTLSLVKTHPGYQEVKTRFARHSLRSWRTFGVSGILFNAEIWDFRNATGQSLPVRDAMARYFGDTDLYVAGPGRDWPSKDHAFYSGETVRKQAVLINDLTRDLPCTLRWSLADAAGEELRSGRIEATARAGVPTMVPIEFPAPVVSRRTEFRLNVASEAPQGTPFLPEGFDLEVFPRPAKSPSAGKVLVYDPVGETTKMLAKARVPVQPLEDRADLHGAALLVVGKKSYGPEFLSLAKRLRLVEAVQEGMNVLVFEQTAGEVLGLKNKERSVREVFVARPGHPLLQGLGPKDFQDLRGESDLVEAYPEPSPESERRWPERGFKWGNRGITATFVYRKPHYAPLVPILECGFDLVDSPLLEGRIGRGRLVLCQVDVTSRYGVDPVSTQLVDQALSLLTQRATDRSSACAWVGESAKRFSAPFGVVASGFDVDRSELIAVGKEPVAPATADAIEAAARRGATVLLLPESPLGARFGLTLKPQRLFIGRVGDHPLLAGLGDGDLYLKAWTTIPAIAAENGWRAIVEPGIVGEKRLGAGRLIACQLDPETFGPAHGRVKALRFWNLLLANLGADRAAWLNDLRPARKLYEEAPFEELPPYINW